MAEQGISSDLVRSTRQHHSSSFWNPVLGVGVLLAGVSTIYQGTQTENLRRQFAASQSDTAALRAQLSYSDRDLQSTLATLREGLNQTRRETDASLARAETLASRHADLVAGKVAEQQQQTQKLHEELGKVQESATDASSKLEGISTQVGVVRTDVDTTKSDLELTRSELQRTRGDLGEISGLIATNAKKVQMLRDLGERNFYEFALSRSGGSQKVGDIQVTFRKVDPKRNRFSVEVHADDKVVEKKDRTINEPVQFYTSRARQPYELVVNQIQKDTIVGYLATPKVTLPRATASVSIP